MNSISKFSLQSHSGPYEDWPLKSRLLLDGEPTRACLAGYSILHQFQIADGYFLVHDWDCPFEGKTHFTLLSNELRAVVTGSGCALSFVAADRLPGDR